MKDFKELAYKIDRLYYDYDAHGYGDTVGSQPEEIEANVTNIEEELSTGEIECYIELCNEIINNATGSLSTKARAILTEINSLGRLTQ